MHTARYNTVGRLERPSIQGCQIKYTTASYVSILGKQDFFFPYKYVSRDIKENSLILKKKRCIVYLKCTF